MHAIRSDVFFDGERFRSGGGVLVLEGKRIVGVEDRVVALPDDLPVLDVVGGSVLPGLIDTHSHLVCDSRPGALDRYAGYDRASLAQVVSEALALQLAAGVTTVRDLGDRDWVALERRDAQRSDNSPAREPMILASGPPLTSPAGHCAAMGGVVANRQALMAAVHERAARGVDVVKIMASGGMTTPGTDVLRTQFTDDDVHALTDAAHEAGLAVTAHAHGLPAVEQVIAAGVDAIEHCSCLTETGVRLDEGLLETLARRALPIGAALDVPGVAQMAAAPPAVRAMMERAGLTPEGMREYRLQAVARMHAAGVRFVAGRDSGISDFRGHGTLRHSIAFLAEAGASTEQALAAATSIAAHACGIGDRTGRLRVGADADVLIVDGDLRSDIGCLGAVRTVMLHGDVMPPSPAKGPASSVP